MANQQVEYPSHINWGINLYIRKRKGRLTIKEHLYPFPVKTEVSGINTAQSIETVLLFRSGKGATLTPLRIRNSDTDIPVFISVMQRIPQLELVLRSFFTNRLTTLKGLTDRALQFLLPYIFVELCRILLCIKIYPLYNRL